MPKTWSIPSRRRQSTMACAAVIMSAPPALASRRVSAFRVTLRREIFLIIGVNHRRGAGAHRIGDPLRRSGPVGRLLLEHVVTDKPLAQYHQRRERDAHDRAPAVVRAQL